jgi:hypothetical protein
MSDPARSLNDPTNQSRLPPVKLILAFRGRRGTCDYRLFVHEFWLMSSVPVDGCESTQRMKDDGRPD